MKQKEKPRKLIDHAIETLYLDRSLDELIDHFVRMKESHSKEYTDLRIESYQNYDTTEYRLFGKRLENDSEYSRRIAWEEKIEQATKERKQKQQEKAQASEYKTYLKLKKKYENSNNK